MHMRLSDNVRLCPILLFNCNIVTHLPFPDYGAGESNLIATLFHETFKLISIMKQLIFLFLKQSYNCGFYMLCQEKIGYQHQAISSQ